MTAEPADRPIMNISLQVNGRDRSLAIEPRETLAEVLRRRLGLTGTKVSCDTQVCGTCTVLVDDLVVSSCTYLAADAEGRVVVTVEGLTDPATGALTPVQQAFLDHAAFQCGYCTPGFIVTATALLAERPALSRKEVIDYLDGNICRCTGYVPILEAIADAAQREGQR